eukprot:CAMPEP_0179101736 /NCGR_PEP_ID=MMETSP0796-20121207/47054_1 /TAXON_ID=73915 /ORGANISM="Pyrodinium bahamense, Strain pbaha01" /LENGTH=174 /DNA_ID=CAMNT_0020799597 /DNA_START=131 /DNA_END=655 /DNA_ORIENTATION=-
MKGEFGQPVLGCSCKGGKATHGYCGFHFHWGSQEDKPWCRTKYNCGFPGLKGSWQHCDGRGVERRRANDGKLYTSKEFKEFFGSEGKDRWTAAEVHVERRLAQDAKAYTVFEFRDYYIDALGETGWVNEWVTARPEERLADDGKWWTWEKFIEFYGKEKAWNKWVAATSSRTDL